METKVSLIIMSHLSDVQTDMFNNTANRARINFVKYLILRYPNTDTYIQAETVYSEFEQKHPNLI